MTKSQGWSESKQSYKKAIELNNGRAAQMGILALMVHEKLDNDPYIINSLLVYINLKHILSTAKKSISMIYLKSNVL